MKGKLRGEREKEVENNIKKQVKKSLGEIKGRKKILHARIKRSKKHRLRPPPPSSLPLTYTYKLTQSLDIPTFQSIFPTIL